jgi:hypothetical protein
MYTDKYAPKPNQNICVNLRSSAVKKNPEPTMPWSEPPASVRTSKRCEMKKIIPYLFLLPIIVLADQGLLLWHLSDIRYSPQYKVYAVVTLQPTKGMLTPDKQRVQVFDNETGKLIWSTSNKISLISSDIYPADDGVHLIVVHNEIQRMFYEMGREPTDEMRKEIENATVLSFYKKDTRIAAYTVKDLGLKAEDVERSMSRFSAFKKDSPPRYIGHFTLENMALRNPLILSKTMRIRGANGSLFYFNITSGELLKEAPKEIKEVDYNWEQTESIDPFGFQISEGQEASANSQKETNEE